MRSYPFRPLATCVRTQRCTVARTTGYMNAQASGPLDAHALIRPTFRLYKRPASVRDYPPRGFNVARTKLARTRLRRPANLVTRYHLRVCLRTPERSYPKTHRRAGHVRDLLCGMRGEGASRSKYSDVGSPVIRLAEWFSIPPHQSMPSKRHLPAPRARSRTRG